MPAKDYFSAHIPILLVVKNMNENSTLDRLVSQMNADERVTLLEKIRANPTLSQEPLRAYRDEDVQGITFGDRYRRLSPIVRMFHHIVGLCTGRTAAEVFEDRQILLLAKSVEASAPGVFDYRQGRLLKGFFASLIDLKRAARFFYNVLDTGPGKDRGAFYAILGSLEMEDIHLRLQNECGPRAILASNPGIPPSDLRQAVIHAMDETLQSISDTKRGVMYHHARSLGHLKDLSCFLFDRFILLFQDSSAGRTCRITPPVKDLMLKLDKVLSSLRDPPSAALLESFFVYELEAGTGKAGFDMESETESLLNKAGEALAVIRHFNRKVPLTRMLRCVTRNSEYFPARESGGEDWFQMYRNYWKRQLEAELAEYFSQKRHRDIVESLEDFFDTRLEPLANVASEKNPGGFPLPEAFTLSFLNAFHSVLNGKIRRVLEPVVMEGEFKRQEDKTSVTMAYNDFMYIAGHIQALDGKLAPTGEYGKRYEQARDEPESLPVKRRKIQIIQSDASKEAWGIIERSHEGMKRIGAMLESISGSDINIECGGLSNFDRLAGKKPAAFVRDIKEAIRSLRQAVKVLSDIIEAGKTGGAG